MAGSGWLLGPFGRFPFEAPSSVVHPKERAAERARPVPHVPRTRKLDGRIRRNFVQEQYVAGAASISHQLQRLKLRCWQVLPGYPYRNDGIAVIVHQNKLKRKWHQICEELQDTSGGGAEAKAHLNTIMLP